jgi:DNA end-binding protein Ku
MKISWKGSLYFGLVTIAIELYSAIQHHRLGFKLLHAKCHHPITYHRWCNHCKKEVEWKDIEKGIKLDDGSFFIITQENLKKLKPEKSDIISIIQFIDEHTVDTLLLDEHYYVAPSSKTSSQSFFLFIAALTRMKKVAIGQFVLRDKEHVCVIRPYNNILLLTTLNYAYEIKKIPQVAKPRHKISSQELKLAEQLIKKLDRKTFDITDFKDTFADKLKRKIKSVKKGIKPKKGKEKIEKAKTTEPSRPSLLKALEASLTKKSRQPVARA